jgi:hypothetical protein
MALWISREARAAGDPPDTQWLADEGFKTPEEAIEAYNTNYRSTVQEFADDLASLTGMEQSIPEFEGRVESWLQGVGTIALTSLDDEGDE